MWLGSVATRLQAFQGLKFFLLQAICKCSEPALYWRPSIHGRQKAIALLVNIAINRCRRKGRWRATSQVQANPLGLDFRAINDNAYCVLRNYIFLANVLIIKEGEKRNESDQYKKNPELRFIYLGDDLFSHRQHVPKQTGALVDDLRQIVDTLV